MSARNRPEAKRARRARRTIQKGRLPAYIDLVEWVQMRSSLSKGRARQVILSGALKVDSHTLGFEDIDGKRRILKPLVPASLRGRIQIVTPEALRDGEV